MAAQYSRIRWGIKISFLDRDRAWIATDRIDGSHKAEGPWFSPEPSVGRESPTHLQTNRSPPQNTH
jgi:hypothetical protein